MTFLDDNANNLALEDLELSESTSEASSDQRRLYQSLSLMNRETNAFESILGSFSNLLHAIVLFPFTQPLLPYVMKKRKKTKGKGKLNYVAKRPTRYISQSGVLEAYDEIKSKIQVNYLFSSNNMAGIFI